MQEFTENLVRLDHAISIAEMVSGLLRSVPEISEVQYAGELRGCVDLMTTVDLVIQGGYDKKIINVLQGHSYIIHLELISSSVINVFYEDCYSDNIYKIVLHFIESPEMFVVAYFYASCDPKHLFALEDIAKHRGFTLSVNGLFKGDRLVKINSEKKLYEKLKLPYILPTMRQGNGEVESAVSRTLPQIITPDDIKGDLHMHTVASDGRDSIEKMVQMARSLGYAYIAITDHSKSTVVANGLDEKRLLDHIDMIKACNAMYKDITVLAGAEVDIMMDGTLDYDDQVLAQLDFVTASIHAGFEENNNDLEINTMRYLIAMENKYVSSISHPTQRIIDYRKPMALDFNAIVDKAVATQTALEISANPKRLDLTSDLCRIANDAGVMFLINTDSHYAGALKNMPLGVANAQRGWVEKDQVVNTFKLKKLKKWIAVKRG